MTKRAPAGAARSPRTVIVTLLLLMAACLTEQPVVPLGDAGDEAFVRRAVPMMWGRNPESIREVDVLVQVLRGTGGDRAGLVRAMAALSSAPKIRITDMM